MEQRVSSYLSFGSVINSAPRWDDDRPVLKIRRSARGGFDGDVGCNTGENECVDSCHAENGAKCGAVEPVGRLSPYDRFIWPGGDLVDDLDRRSALQKGRTVDEGTKQR